MKIVPTFEAKIYLGFRPGYVEWDFSKPEISYLTEDNLNRLRTICDKFVDKEGDCVTITPTEFRYVAGYESGAIIGFINYPRFPRDEKDIKNRALKLAQKLLVTFHQNRVSVVFSDETVMLEK